MVLTMLETIVIGIALFIIFYIIFFWFYSTVKSEKDFANQVYWYLVRRYKETTIVDYGGISTDPIIQCRNAGPFNIIEVKVVTDKSKNKIDQDIIIRGEVDGTKYQRGSYPSTNLNLHLASSYVGYTNKIPLGAGMEDFDQRFLILSDDHIFNSQLLYKTHLSDLMMKTFDLEGYSIRWELDGSPTIQIRMETMSSNSFMQAFNILLGTVGLLTEKGFISRLDSGIQLKEVKIPTSKELPVYEDKKIVIPSAKWDVSDEKQTKYSQTSIERQLITNSIPSHNESQSYTVNNKLSESLSIEKTHRELFNSLKYQAKDIIYEENQVRVLGYSSTVKEFIFTFPGFDTIQINALSNRPPTQSFELKIDLNQRQKSRNWSDPWSGIEIKGSPELLEKLRIRSSIANRIQEFEKLSIKVQGLAHQNVDFVLTIPRNKEGVNGGYSILKDLIWFIEMSSF
ncbi:hypothetical protein [Candidatus Hodarchaeum mangrovi]